MGFLAHAVAKSANSRANRKVWCAFCTRKMGHQPCVQLHKLAMASNLYIFHTVIGTTTQKGPPKPCSTLALLVVG